MKKLFSVVAGLSLSAVALAQGLQEVAEYGSGRCRWHKAYLERPTTPQEFTPYLETLSETWSPGARTIKIGVANLDNAPNEVVFDRINQAQDPIFVTTDYGNCVVLKKTSTYVQKVGPVFRKVVSVEEGNCFNRDKATTRETFEYSKDGIDDDNSPSSNVQYVYTRESSKNWDRSNTDFYGYGCRYRNLQQ